MQKKRSVHAKFHADWNQTCCAIEIHTDRQTDKLTDLFDDIDRFEETNPFFKIFYLEKMHFT